MKTMYNARVRLRLMEDAFIISCHETQKQAKWLDGKDRPHHCSICDSMHPDEFMFQLLNGGFVRGWMWEDGHPVFCETDGGLFQAAHLLDMSEAWLFSNAPTIFDYTGIAFFWEKEAIGMWSPWSPILLGKGSSITLTEEQRDVARRLLKEKYYNRRLP